jgi:hypothetical protein
LRPIILHCFLLVWVPSWLASLAARLSLKAKCETSHTKHFPWVEHLQENATPPSQQQTHTRSETHTLHVSVPTALAPPHSSHSSHC